MIYVELLGYLACALVLAAFCMPSIVPLRIVAIFSNVAFIGYASLGCLTPVLLLHAVLLPVNAYRLGRSVRCSRTADGEPDRRRDKRRGDARR